MKYILCTLSVAFFFNRTFTQVNSIDALKKMYAAYAGRWYRTLTNTQITERYHKGKLNKVDTLYCATSFPDKLRIDYGSLDKGNAEIFRSDSSFSFRHGKLFRSRKAEDDPLSYFSGACFFFPFDSLILKIKEIGIDLDEFHEENQKGKTIYVIGANESDEKQTQLWIEKERLLIVRILIYTEKQKDDYWFEDHIRLGSGWKETKLSYFSNDELLYKETLQDLKADLLLKESLFDPRKFGE